MTQIEIYHLSTVPSMTIIFLSPLGVVSERLLKTMSMICETGHLVLYPTSLSFITNNMCSKQARLVFRKHSVLKYDSEITN